MVKIFTKLLKTKHIVLMITITGILIVLFLNVNNIAYCGNTNQDNHTTELQEYIRELYNDMNQDALDEFGRNINLRIELEPEIGWPQESDLEIENTRYQALVYFTMGTIALFLFSRYHQEILNTLFNIGQDIVTEIPRAIGNITLYPRQQVFNYAMRLIETEEGRTRVLNAINIYRQDRNLATGG